MNESTPLFIEKINPNDEFVILLEWLINDGEKVEKGQVIARVESSKAAYEFESPQGGYLQQLASAGTKLPFDQPIGKLWPEKNFSLIEKHTPIATGPEIIMTAKAKRLMQKAGLNPTHFTGLNRITENDVQAFIEKKSLSQVTRVPGQLKHLSSTKEFEVALLRRGQKNLIFSTVTRAFQYSKILQIRNSFAAQGTHVSTGELVSWSTAKALKKFPLLNSCRLADGIYFYEPVNIGIVINIKHGLKVPVIRNADSLTQEQIAAEFKQLTLKYLRNELKPTDLSHGTFTVSDLSSLNVQSFTPLIFEGQAAILGICSPHHSDTSLNVTLSFDHEIADAMIGAQFLAAIEENIEKCLS